MRVHATEMPFAAFVGCYVFRRWGGPTNHAAHEAVRLVNLAVKAEVAIAASRVTIERPDQAFDLIRPTDVISQPLDCLALPFAPMCHVQLLAVQSTALAVKPNSFFNCFSEAV